MFSTLFLIYARLFDSSKKHPTSASTIVETRDQTPALCSANVVMLNLGVSMCIGAIFAKTWRLFRIFNNTSLQLMVITDWHLLAIVLVGLVFDACILGWWLGSSPFSVLENPFGACDSLYESADSRHTIVLMIAKVSRCGGSEQMRVSSSSQPIVHRGNSHSFPPKQH